MLTNVKTELIYYNTTKDFEFEFNLCAVCQMRLLTEVPSNKTEFLNSLAKSVSRSKVIIIITDINDEFTAMLASAINFSTENIDRDTYAVVTSKIQNIISGAVPLVTQNGYLGGFILECGPQSLIVLDTERKPRSEIMLSFVNQYIKDVSVYNYEIPDVPKNETVKPKYDDNTVTAAETSSSDTDLDIVSSSDNTDNSSNADDITAAKGVADTQSDSGESEPSEKADVKDDIFVAAKENIENRQPVNVDFNTTFGEYTDNTENSYTEPEAKTEKKVSVPILLLSIILLLLVAFIVYSLVIDPILSGNSVSQNFKDVFSFLFK